MRPSESSPPDMDVNVSEPAVHGEESQGSRSPRWVWVAAFAVVAVVLFIAYLRMSGTYPATSERSPTTAPSRPGLRCTRISRTGWRLTI